MVFHAQYADKTSHHVWLHMIQLFCIVCNSFAKVLARSEFYLNAHTLGMGRYTYLPIQYYHDTWVPIRYVLRSIVIRYCYVLRFLFLTIKKNHILAVTIAIRYYNLLCFCLLIKD